MSSRRAFITLLGSAAYAWPLAARAQQPAMPVIGFLRTAAAASSAHLVNAFHQGLNATGFVEGQNVAVEYRWADDQPHRVSALAADLVQRRVSMIVTNGIAVPAVREAAGAIPIIFLTGYDPVRTGFVTSLSRPGGNTTGVVFTQTDLLTKQLGLLHELVPSAVVIAALLDANQLESDIESRQAEAAGRAIGRKILIVKAASESEFQRGLRDHCTSRRGRAAHRRQPGLHQSAQAARHARDPQRAGDDLFEPRIPRGWRIDELRTEPDRRLPSRRQLCRQDPQG
jgi:putative ABC transport system substrate-binding protein